MTKGDWGPADLPANAAELGPLINPLIAQRKFERAQELIEAAARKWPNAATVDLFQAQLFAATGQSDQAKSLYEKVLTRQPKMAAAAVQLGLLLVDRNDIAGAEAILARAEADGTNIPESGRLRLRAAIAKAKGDWATVIDMTSQLRAVTGNERIDQMIAEAQIASGDIAGAERTVDAIIGHSPSNPKTYSLALDVQLMKERERHGADADPHQLLLAALRDEKTYKLAIRREGEAWGQIFSDADRAERIERATLAKDSAKDRMAAPKLAGLLQGQDFSSKVGLSLACGTGRAERALMDHGICRRFDAMDIAEDALSQARRLAAEGNYDIAYSTGDLNKVELEPEAYDLVVTNSCLHHVLELEHLADQIWKALRPGGFLWIVEYIGEARFQWSDERLAVCREIAATLPDEVKWDAVNRVPMKLERSHYLHIASPFESIRSNEIVEIFTKRFKTNYAEYRDAVLMQLARQGMMEAYTRTEENRAHLKRIMELDEQLVADGTLKPQKGELLLVK